ncbi:uncharacterized protein LOC143233864 isoform X2 [Tachypleus tridentatus]|uniref:uncharacterized protein LOC143233864 isoform X2 n=1 Tax=Tachypleus tridentatus TaxID=6853 RepID=UPI003FD2D4D0
MWSLIHANRENYGNIPRVRSKHALCSTKEGIIYLLGGRSGNLPMKDLWKYDPEDAFLAYSVDTCDGVTMPKGKAYTTKEVIDIFNNEESDKEFETDDNESLLVTDESDNEDICGLESAPALETKLWEKKHLNTAVFGQPSGRRGHTSLKYNGMMYVYGGYQDLKGSLDDLWAFDFDLERWHLYVFPRSFEQPPPRHSHTSVLHDAAMWVYGGMTDLQERGDFWKLDFPSLRWSRLRTNKAPGVLHNHSAVKSLGHMYVFGGERGVTVLNDLWRYHFATQIWERVIIEGIVPSPVIHHVAVANPAQFTWEEKFQTLNYSRTATESKQYRFCDSPSTNENKSSTQNLLESAHSNHLTSSESEKSRHYLKVCTRPFSRLCSKSSNSEETEKNKQYVAVAYNVSTNQVQLRSLRDANNSGNLLSNSHNSCYNVLYGSDETLEEEQLVCLLEKTSSLQESPCFTSSIFTQRSISSDESLEPESKTSFQCKSLSRDDVLMPLNLEVLEREDSVGIPDLGHVERQLKMSQSLYRLCWTSNEKVTSEDLLQFSNSETTIFSPKEGCSNELIDAFSIDSHSPISVPNKNTSTSLLNMSDRNTDNCAKDMKPEGWSNQRKLSTGAMLINLEDTNFLASEKIKISEQTSATSPLLDEHSKIYSPGDDNFGIPFSASRSSGYQSVTEYEWNCIKDFHQDFASILNPVSLDQLLNYKKEIEMKDLNPTEVDSLTKLHSHNSLKNNNTKQVENILESSQKNSCMNIKQTATVIPSVIQRETLSDSVVRQSKNWKIFRPNPLRSPSKIKKDQHEWELCMYVIGGQEQGISSLCRQPITVWKLYI